MVKEIVHEICGYVKIIPVNIILFNHDVDDDDDLFYKIYFNLFY